MPWHSTHRGVVEPSLCGLTAGALRRLEETVAQLEAAVREREQIRAIREEEGPEEKEGMRDARMKAVVTRRKLVDLAKLQSEEIKFLRTQVVRRCSLLPLVVVPMCAYPSLSTWTHFKACSAGNIAQTYFRLLCCSSRPLRARRAPAVTTADAVRS